MKVYELMSALADLPSGAEILCSVTLTADELWEGVDFGKDDKGNTIYNITKAPDCVESFSDNKAILNV